MALTGTFTADFSSFYDAVTKATVKLKTFEEGAASAGQSVNRVAESLNGTRIVQQATIAAEAVRQIGGASKLTDAELRKVNATITEAMEKLERTGQAVPLSFGGIAKEAAQRLKPALEDLTPPTKAWHQELLTVGNAFRGLLGLQVVQWATSFGREILNDADALTKLNAQTGISIQWLQRFQVAGDDAGVSVQSIAGAVSQMQNRLAGGDQSAVSAVKALGLSLEELRRKKPEEQFVAIAERIAAIQDPAKQTQMAMDAFGRAGIEMLPLIKRGFDDVKNAAVGMSDETVKALDEAGDKFAAYYRTTKGYLALAIVSLVEYGNTVKEVFAGRAIELAFQRDKQAAEELTAALKKMDAQIAVADADRLKAANKQPSTGVIPIPSDREIAQLDRAIAKQVEANKEAKRGADQRAKADKEAKQSIVALEGTATMFAGQMGTGLEKLRQISATTIWTANEMAPALRQAITSLEGMASLFSGQLKAGLLPDKNLENDLLAGWRDLWNQQQQELDALPYGPQEPNSEALANAKDYGAKLGATIIAAIQGGGSVSRALGATIGGDLATKYLGGVGDKLGKAIGGKMGAGIGSALGTAIPVVGSLIGSLGGDLLGKAFGKLFGKSEHSKVNDMRDAFVAASGGIHELNVQAQAAGLTLDTLLRADKVHEYEAAVEELNQAFKFQDESIKVVMETAQRYGFTLEQLGPALQRAELDKQAQQLYKDFQVLVSAGIDVVNVTDKMAEAVSTYVQNAVAMGVEVPNAMKPMLEQFVKAGTLIDAQGNAITNLEDAGISFALTMSEGFKMLIDEVKRLTDAIARGLGIAISNLPPIPKSSSGPPMESYQEGTDGFRNFGSGTPAMLHGWEAVVPRDKSSGGAFAELAASPTAATVAPGSTVIINAAGFFDTPGDLQRLADKVDEALTAKYGLNTRMRAA